MMKQLSLSALSIQTRLLGLALLLAAITALYACGGGGGGEAPAPAPAPAFPTASAPVPAPMFWSGVVPINSLNDRFPQIQQVATAMDASGNAFAIWIQRDEVGKLNQSIWVNRYSASTGAWSTSAPLDTQVDGGVIEPQIAMDAKGNAMAVWRQYLGTAPGIYAKRYVAGSGWGDDVRIAGTELIAVSQPQVDLDAAGNAFAVWTQNQDKASRSGIRVWARHFDATSGAWGDAVPIESSGELIGEVSSTPQVSADASGTVVVVWTRLTLIENGVGSIWSNRFDGQAWGSAVPVETQAGDAGGPSIAMDGKGNALALWVQSDGTQYNIWANRYKSANHAWGEPVQVSSKGSAYSPQAAFDPAGNAMAVWAQKNATHLYEESARQMDAGTGAWGAVASLGQSVGFAQAPQIAMDASGNAIAVWVYWDGSHNSVFSNSTSAGSWGSATPLESEPDRYHGSSGVRIAMNASGAATVVWANFVPANGGGIGRIFANIHR